MVKLPPLKNKGERGEAVIPFGKKRNGHTSVAPFPEVDVRTQN